MFGVFRTFILLKSIQMASESIGTGDVGVGLVLGQPWCFSWCGANRHQSDSSRTPVYYQGKAKPASSTCDTLRYGDR